MGLVLTALGALAGQGQASAAEGEIRGADSQQAIKGSYIVVLKDGISTRSAVGSQAQKYGATVKHRYDKALNGYAADMSESQARRLAADPSVAYVQQNQTIRLSESQPNPPSWGIDRIDQPDLPLGNSYQYSTGASGVHAYILDTGIDTAHNDFEGRATWGLNAVGDGKDTDCHGHGTHVAGTIGGKRHGVAKAVELTAVKVLSCSGQGDTSTVVAGIDWVTTNAEKPAVANMSLGGGSDPALDEAVKRSVSAGITYSLASGNGNVFGMPQDACRTSPARVGGSAGTAITVNASDKKDSKASFSNYGRCTDVYAPGVDITSAWIGSDTATKSASGTSMAAPHVAGAAALYLAGHPSATPAQVKQALVGAASQGKIKGVTSDTPNRLVYTGQGGQTPPPAPGPDPEPEPKPWYCMWVPEPFCF
ncbi:S8 family peptidase [Amycolatopsis sp. EV170708-02-1]|uniref:S8 family peptidase n=1 Tax=Amycolatopsis sp. EV170708-02-1 TaxID=2919322 RepID=UPI001F0BD43D|nr:S8 family peptidase [Amycolatopsis sp. EV170708-02-1]UMO99940.1 S8 family peptidase [Amycolatopsis sp. EV170708-02-1]